MAFVALPGLQCSMDVKTPYNPGRLLGGADLGLVLDNPIKGEK